MAGLAHLIDFIQNFRYKKEDIDYLRSLGLFDEAYLTLFITIPVSWGYLCYAGGDCGFSGGGSSAFHGTITEAMLLETGLSMILNHESLIATKAEGSVLWHLMIRLWNLA